MKVSKLAKKAGIHQTLVSVLEYALGKAHYLPLSSPMELMARNNLRDIVISLFNYSKDLSLKEDNRKRRYACLLIRMTKKLCNDT